MDRSTATTIARALAEIDLRMNQLAASIETIPDLDERKAMRRVLGVLMVDSIDVLRSVTRQYPDLDPDKDADWRKQLNDAGADTPGSAESDA